MGDIEVSDSWNNRLKTLAEGLSGLIPTVGKLVKVAIELFWPDETVDIWSLIKSEVEHLIDIKILELELGERESQLNGLRDSLKMYYSSSNKERASLLSAILVQCNEIYSELTESENAIHFIPLTIAHAHLHLTVLMERYQHGLELYTDAKDQSEWYSDLTEKVKDYKDFFFTVYFKWRKWREDEISVSEDKTENPTIVPPFFYWTVSGTTKDKFNGDSVKYEDDWNSNKDTFKDVQNRAKERMYNDADAAMMMDAYIRTFNLDNFLPCHISDPPIATKKVSKVTYGPYSQALKSGSHEKKDMSNISSKDQTDTCGIITKICVSAYNSVDMIQFTYKDKGEGTVYGTPCKSNLHTIDLTDTHVTGVKMGFSKGIMAKIQFKLSDGSYSQSFGNKGSWGMKLDKEISADNDFRLVGAVAKNGSGPSHTTPVAEIRFMFQHISVSEPTP